MEGNVYFETGILVVLLITARILYLVHKISTGHSKLSDRKRIYAARTVICIGSGGHTTEMLSLLKNMDFKNKYQPRYYIIANNDKISYEKVVRFESSKASSKNYFIKLIPRSREVNQSFITSVLTTIYAILYSIPYIVGIKPDLVLCNGPGSCIPICLITFLLKVGCIYNTRIVFIESFCRVKTFSLSGKILMYFADNILVQWPTLKQKLKRAEYIGQLM